jgi:hypothetical protein
MDEPPPTGGTIPDGLYVKTRQRVFSGPDGGTSGGGTIEGGAFLFGGNCFQYVDGADRYSGRFLASGSWLMLAYTCPAQSPVVTWRYTVSGNELWIYSLPGHTFIDVYTRQ